MSIIADVEVQVVVEDNEEGLVEDAEDGVGVTGKRKPLRNSMPNWTNITLRYSVIQTGTIDQTKPAVLHDAFVYGTQLVSQP